MINLDVMAKSVAETAPTPQRPPIHWATQIHLLWEQRRLLSRIAAASLLLSFAIAFLMPKKYTAVTSIMPPEQQGSGAMLLAALAGHDGLSTLGSLASGLLGSRTTTPLFINLLRSGTVSDHLIARFDLRHVYRKRYNVDAAKHLAHVTTISDDKKSGVITIKVEDTDPVRARDIARGYLEELNRLLTETSTSSARQERIFIEQRLRGVQNDLEAAQIALSEFSSRNSTVDLKEQTRAMVDAGARIEGELMVEQSGLQSLRQVYGDGNIRVREAEARVASLQHDLNKLAGSSSPSETQVATSNDPAPDDNGALYPPLRQLPHLGVRYADLYRQVKVQEAVFDLLTQQYEMARIEEAKDVPVVHIIDQPGIPEKKSFPPRLLMTLSLTSFSVIAASLFVLVRHYWAEIEINDPRKRLASSVVSDLRTHRSSFMPADRGAA
jgi:uncharacterized protein involved in exopolysaccharide biosynthesis